VDHEYVVRKKVQNRAIVREVDHARQRDLVRTVLGGACVLLAVLFAAWQHHEGWRLGHESAMLQRDFAALRESRRHLHVEKAHLVSPSRIDAIATGQLQMKAPSRETSAVLERVTATPSASRSVVASR
jgi:cell division protein FtsL